LCSQHLAERTFASRRRFEHERDGFRSVPERRSAEIDDAERQQVYGRLIREMSVVGSDDALNMLTNILSYILWSEGTPPRGPAFEIAVAALRHTLQVQMECLDTGWQKGGGHVN
jgi:hypothetical protein